MTVRRKASISEYNWLEHTLTTIFFALAGVAVVVWLLKYWTDTNSKDLGTMSTQWLAEHNSSSHP